MNVKITRWQCVASWKWNVNDTDCGICRMPFDSCCSDCKFPGDECPPVWGECKHAFHMHCIYKWLNGQANSSLCPMCRQRFQIARSDIAAAKAAAAASAVAHATTAPPPLPPPPPPPPPTAVATTAPPATESDVGL